MKVIALAVAPHIVDGVDACLRMMAWVEGQALILMREPDNPVDGNAILILELTGQRTAYVDEASANLLAPRMDAGEGFVASVKTRVELYRCWAGHIHFSEWPTVLIESMPPEETHKSTKKVLDLRPKVLID